MRRTTILFVSALLVLGLTACGDDRADPVVAPVGSDAPPTSESAAYQHPTGADEVVVSIEQEGGFAPVEMIFARVPTVLVTGDGRQLTPGPQIAIYPGPLLPNVQVADLGEAGVQDLLALADRHGLLQAREYATPTNIADATDTVVTIRVGGETYVHRAYALGLEGGLDDTGAPVDDDARRQLAEFVREASMVSGDTTSFEPDAYLVRAMPVDDLSGFDIEPTVVAWPEDVDVDLATAECTEVAADAVGDTFTTANQLTFFEQAGATYQLAVKPLLPGSGC